MVAGNVLIGMHDHQFILKMVGDVRVPWCYSLENYCEAVLNKGDVSGVFVDLSDAENLDSTTLGVLAKLAMQTRSSLHRNAEIICPDRDLQRLLQSMAFDQVFDICGQAEADRCHDEFSELPFVDCSELEMQQSVVDAHRILMGLSEENRAEFLDLVMTLESTLPAADDD